MRAPRAQTAGVTVRALEPGDGIDALFDLRVRGFGLVPGDRPDRWQAEHEPGIRDGRCLGAFAGRRLVAAAQFHDMTQWWNGRAVPMAGVAGVTVAPEERGLGVGRALVTALLEVIAARRYPLSVLFPSAADLPLAGLGDRRHLARGGHRGARAALAGAGRRGGRRRAGTRAPGRGAAGGAAGRRRGGRGARPGARRRS